MNNKKILIPIIIFSLLILSSSVIGKELTTTKEEIIWKDNCQEKCVDNNCNRIIGRTFYANDTDNKCKRIEEAKSLKNSPIQCQVISDNFHFVECLDYNFTAVKIKLSIKDKLQEKNVPLTIYELVFNEITKETDYKEKNIINFVFNDALLNKKEYELWLPLNFSVGEYLKFGENSTLLQIGGVGNISADVYAVDTDGFYDLASQVRMDISSIPSGQVIDSAKCCLYNYYNTDDLDNDVRFWRVDNQTWTDSLTCSGWGAQTLVNQTTTVFDSITVNSYNCFNCTVVVKEEYDVGNNFTSFRFDDPDYGFGTCDTVYNGYSLAIGDGYYGYEIYYEDEENYGSSGKYTYINVTYTPTDTPPTTPTSILGNNSADLNISWTNESITMNCSGSTDADNDTITYVLERGNRTINETLTKFSIAYIGFEDEGTELAKWAEYQAVTGEVWETVDTDECTAPAGSYMLSGDGDFDPNLCIYNRTTGINISGYVNLQVSVQMAGEDTESSDQRLFYYWDGDSWVTCEDDSGRYDGSTCTGWATFTCNISMDAGDMVYVGVGWETSSTAEHMFWDDINITGWKNVTENTTTWTEIGNHTNGSTFAWNVSSINNTNDWDLRCRAIDLAGSNTYSSYYTKNSYFNISITGVPVGDECDYNGSGDFLMNNVTCTIDTTTDVNGNGFIIQNHSTIIVNASVYNYSHRMLRGNSIRTIIASQ